MAGRKILLVEGNDDKHVLKHICGERGVGMLEVKPQGNVQRLLENLPVRLKESNVEALGVVIDADTDLTARWQSLRDRLTTAGYPTVPVQPAPTGTILPPPSDSLLPRVGVWIMPDNQTKGILEDFLYFLVPTGSLLFSHVESRVAGIPETSTSKTDLFLTSPTKLTALGRSRRSPMTRGAKGRQKLACVRYGFSHSSFVIPTGLLMCLWAADRWRWLAQSRHQVEYPRTLPPERVAGSLTRSIDLDGLRDRDRAWACTQDEDPIPQVHSFFDIMRNHHDGQAVLFLDPQDAVLDSDLHIEI